MFVSNARVLCAHILSMVGAFWKCITSLAWQYCGFTPLLHYNYRSLVHGIGAKLLRSWLHARIANTFLHNYQYVMKKVYDTGYSQAVTHPSTNPARRCLTSVIRRELVLSAWYGRRRKHVIVATI